jgi:predicted nuclease of predicted toxin-antitoxin system
VKLLFDQNLSRRLVQAFSIEFPGSTHVLHVGLERASDGHPPKVVWIRRGNCSTATIELILRAHQDDLIKFAESEQGSFLALL